MSYSQEWLESPNSLRIILAELSVYDVVASAETFIYVSNGGYITSDGSISFNPIIMGEVTLKESLSPEGGVAMAFGDLELSNPNGEYDIWLDPSKYIWSNRSIKVYLGDPTWVTTGIAQIRTNFLNVFNGIIDDIDSRNKNTLNIKFRDKLERLNAPLTEDKLGTYGVWPGGQQNSDDIIPVIFGEVHNVTPLLVNPAELEYQVNNGLTESIIEIRDNGVPIYTAGTSTSGATLDLTNGRFKLNHPAAGTITASVQGVKKSVNMTTGALVSGTYVNNVANLITLIVTQFGKSSTRFTSADLDLVNLSAFATANTQSVGIPITDRTNVLNVCKDLAASIGAQLFVTRQGLLQLIKYGVGITALSDPITITTVDNSSIILNSLSISSRIPVTAATKIGYCKNWTVQQDLSTAIPEQDKVAFATEWYSTTNTNSSVQSLYKLDSDPVQKDTLLVVDSAAQTEAARLTNFYSQQRTVYKFTGTSALLSLKLGQPLTLISDRFDLFNGGAGRLGQIVGLRPNWSKNNIEVEVLI